MRKLLIDADFMCWAAGFAAERTTYLLLRADGKVEGPFDRRADSPEPQEGDVMYERTDALDFAIARAAMEARRDDGGVNTRSYDQSRTPSTG